MAKSLPTRKDVPTEYTWRLEDIFATDEQWEEEFQAIAALLPKFSEYKGKLGESAETLYEALQYRDHVLLRLGKLYAYAHMRHDEDTTNSLYQGFESRAEGLYAEAGNAMAFIVPEILALDESVVRTFLQQYEPLRLYEHELDEMNRQRPHVLSEKEEALLAQAADVMNASSNTFGALNNADLRFPTIQDENGEEVEVTHGRYIRFLESEDRRVRHDAFKAVYDT
ncbi:MAG: oligoendopeptidase F, partial [Anoxybacillus ayderensis]|nr:oligoendopeptidase F [Anoxybacillus ayderensis]